MGNRTAVACSMLQDDAAGCQTDPNPEGTWRQGHQSSLLLYLTVGPRLPGRSWGEAAHTPDTAGAPVGARLNDGRPFQATASLVSHDAASLMLQCSVFPCVSNAPFPPMSCYNVASACVRISAALMHVHCISPALKPSWALDAEGVALGVLGEDGRGVNVRKGMCSCACVLLCVLYSVSVSSFVMGSFYPKFQLFRTGIHPEPAAPPDLSHRQKVTGPRTPGP
ncbi:hypothetical protein BGZ61DRAFT_46221 [Ilyonectria robusta]|uniref:uncharacterized protein n=1 Tax=Ilyonectria robusta TaxID=1079257 RepID=UPI001E8D9E15|nr:uncharacterized protein BGZ61DRAFT_46221 [Ilyonectria robusta]KAH8686809.1 hypothetical protein BGZ61DRAFT_46221 [Ilyonectria robusta]